MVGRPGSGANQSNRRRRFDYLLVAVFFSGLAVIRAGSVDERDAYWSIRAGVENLAGIPLVRPDTWSWAAAGDWYPNSPLWNQALGGGWILAGFWGFFGVVALVLLALFLASFALSRVLGARRLPGLVGLLLAYLCGFAMLNPRATVAAELLTLSAVWLALQWSRSAAERSTLVNVAFALFAGLGLSLLGNWTHLSFLLLSPALALAWAVIWMLTPELSRPQRWSMVLAGAAGWLAGVLASPYGLVGGLARSQVVREACEGLILEWSSPFAPGVPPAFLAPAIGAALLGGGALWWCVRRLRSKRFDLSTRGIMALTVIGLPTAVAGLTAIRFLGMALLTLAPIAAAALTAITDRLRPLLVRRFQVRGESYLSGEFWRVVLAAVAVLLLPGIALLGGAHGVPSEAAALQQLPANCRLFSSIDTGGVAVLVRPDGLVWIDGRGDFYGREHLIETAGYFAGTTAEVVPPGTGCIALDVDDALAEPLIERLHDSADWHRAGEINGIAYWLPS